MSDRKDMPLQDNEHVKELLAIMKQNQVDVTDLNGLLHYVGKMEKQLSNAVGELQNMRSELSTMREEQNHPLRTALQNTIRTLEKNINEARKALDAVKQQIIDGCKNAVSAFKEKGISALHNLAAFFKIEKGLQSFRSNINQSITADEKALAKIEAFSTEFHKAGTHVRNMGRTIMGKEATQEVKSKGSFAKGVELPYKADLAILKGVGKSVDAAIAKLHQLEKSSDKHVNKKPSVLENLAKMKKQAELERKEPVKEKQRKQEVSI
ncbi:MAG: DUF6674 family protein [Lachnospiraceae bacterium]